MATDQTYRIGIIGCGGMGRSHSRSWQKQPNAEIVAAMDIYEESAKKVADEFEIPATYTDVDEMLAKEDLDIVSITTWQGPRAEATVAAANAGVKELSVKNRCLLHLVRQMVCLPPANRTTSNLSSDTKADTVL